MGPGLAPVPSGGAMTRADGFLFASSIVLLDVLAGHATAPCWICWAPNPMGRRIWGRVPGVAEPACDDDTFASVFLRYDVAFVEYASQVELLESPPKKLFWLIPARPDETSPPRAGPDTTP